MSKTERVAVAVMFAALAIVGISYVVAPDAQIVRHSYGTTTAAEIGHCR